MSGPYQLYRDLGPAVEAALRASIQRFGVLVPVAMDQHGNVLDGHQRIRIAEQLGVDYPVQTIAVAGDGEARDIARSLNEDRRAVPKEERLPMEKALREEGHSLRAIAGAVGVGLGTVQRDLATVPPDTVPDRVTGLDGKSRPSRRESKRSAETDTVAPQRNRLKKPSAQKALTRAIEMLSGLRAGIETVDFSDCEPSEGQLRQLTEGIRALVRLRRTLTGGES